MKPIVRQSLFLLLLLSPYRISAMEDSENGDSDSEIQQIAEEQVAILQQEGIKYEDVEKVWQTTPATVKNWARELQEQQQRIKSLPYRLFLYGPSGSGKTMMSLGIWKKNPTWKLKMIATEDFINKYSDTAMEELKNAFDGIEGQKTILIIDDAHILLGRHKNEAIKGAPELLKNFLDKHAENKDMMIIFNGDEIPAMQDSLKNRLFVTGVGIVPPLQKDLYEIFHYYLQQEGFDSKDIQLKDFERMCTIIENIKVGRDVRWLVSFMKKHIRDSGYNDPLNEYHFTQRELTTIATQFKKEANVFGIWKREISDREFQERLHRDSKKYQAILTTAMVVGSVGLTTILNELKTVFLDKILQTLKPEQRSEISMQENVVPNETIVHKIIIAMKASHLAKIVLISLPCAMVYYIWAYYNRMPIIISPI